MTSHKIAVIAGDGIGKEVVPEGIRVLDAAAAKFGFALEWDELPWSCDYYLEHGRMMPEDGLEQIRGHAAIFLGAVGMPALVPDHVSLWGLLIRIRRAFEQYANIRPVRLMPGIRSPLADRKPGEIDFIVVRENNEGEYSSIGGRSFEGTEQEIVQQTTVFTRRGVDRIMRYAFDLAAHPAGVATSPRPPSPTAWPSSCPTGTSASPRCRRTIRTIRTDQYHIDILTAHFVQNPDRFDVVVASNLFGDILSDLGPACTGTIAIAPSANLNPERDYPSMFEPVHGSAPDIAGRNIANPIGQIWSGSMMLDHLGHKDAAAAVLRAIETVLADGPRTPDLGGTRLDPGAGQGDRGGGMSAAGQSLIPGFALRDVQTRAVRIRCAVGGSGPPLLLLHGHPQTHATWHKVAPALAQRFTVVAADLRGYGDSDKPAGGEGHVNYSKRAMARDQVELMAALGFDRFAVVGHDRGGRVAHRMALDHAAAVERLAVLDIAPTATMYARTNKEFATRYFWWFFLIQPLPAARAADRRRSRIFPAHAYRRPDQDPGRGRPGDLRGIFALLPRSRHAPCDLRGLPGCRHHRPGARCRRRRSQGHGTSAGAVGRQGHGGCPLRRAGDLAREGRRCPGPGAGLRARPAGGTARSDRGRAAGLPDHLSGDLRQVDRRRPPEQSGDHGKLTGWGRAGHADIGQGAAGRRQRRGTADRP